MPVDKTGCLGTTIKTATGLYFDVAEPWGSRVEIIDIATALSHICRFGGHCPEFYSVAEHCIHATRLARERRESDSVQLAILLHDASEAYVGDMVKPLKQLLPRYQELEENIQFHVQNSLGLGSCSSPVVKRYDHIMLKSEKLALFPEDREEWSGFEHIEAIPNWRPYFWSWRTAFDEFMAEYHSLTEII